MSENNRGSNENNNNNEILLKEIDLIQSCINRMAQNSFIIKGWAISLNGIILGIFFDKEQPVLAPIVCLISVLCFWYLDAFFLRTEKMYRWKYEWVITERLKTKKYAYDLNPYNHEMWLKVKNKKGNLISKKKPCIISIMGTQTLLPMYIAIISVNAALLILAISCEFCVS